MYNFYVQYSLTFAIPDGKTRPFASGIEISRYIYESNLGEQVKCGDRV